MIINRRRIGLLAGMAAAVLLSAGALIASSGPANATVTNAEAAPDFTLTNSYGEEVSLSDFAGQRVVLEWTNHGCPFVKKHYATPPANMQSLQAGAAENEVVWLTIISSAPGKQGHVTGDEANELTTNRSASPAHVLLDPTGEVGRLYDAKTTPHIFIIDADGTLVYQGAIDDNPSSNVEDIATATNYVAASFAALDAGEMPEPGVTKAYGCGVKYPD